ncbi:MAG: hypothetical protein M1836_002455 [Candelina mexicana]|nr:MAG: hypothetical protein M1836_002455 [Candelina mexicana]
MTRSKTKKEKQRAEREAQQKISTAHINHLPSNNGGLDSAHQDVTVTTPKTNRRSGKRAGSSDTPDLPLALPQLSLTSFAHQQPKSQHGDLFQTNAARGPRIGWKQGPIGHNSALDGLRETYKSDHAHPLGSFPLSTLLSDGATPFVPSQPIGAQTDAIVLESAQETFESRSYTAQVQKPKKTKKKKKSQAKVSPPSMTLSLRSQPKDRNSAPPLKEPQPTAQYIGQAITPPRNIGLPQDLLLVLDLNGTILHRSKSSKKITLRPNGDRFLEYLLNRHNLMVWSSAKPENVDRMCRYLFQDDQRALLKGEWGRDRLGLSAQQYNAKVQVYKRLEWVWEDDSIAVSHPHYAKGGRWDQSNTVLIDDTTLKATAQPHNLLEVPEFTGGPAQMKLDLLRQVVGYVEELRWQVDVSSFIKQNPFRVDSGWDHHWPDDSPT